MHPRVFTAGCLAAVGLFFLLATMSVQSAPLVPQGPHCIGTGPLTLDPNFCGCTWGGVYYRGQAVDRTSVTLQFGAQSRFTDTRMYSAEIYPFYTMTGTVLGAKLNDLMTVTTQFAGQTATRTFRARPDGTGEQQVPLVLPEQGEWTPWLASGFTRTLALQGNTLWAGGPAGLRAINLTSGLSTTHALPWATSAVMAVATAPNGHVWAAGPYTLAEFDGNRWHNREVPFGAPIRSLAVDPTTNALWLGGGTNTGVLAVFTTSWQTSTVVTAPVNALAVDSTGNLWVGTFGGGAYRRDHRAVDVNSGWTHFTIANGLASDEIYAVAVTDTEIWFATNSYRVNGQPVGGVSRYRPAANTWRTFTLADGLPADPVEPDATAPVYAVATGADGSIWIGALTNVADAEGGAVYLLATPERWVQDTTIVHSRINALTVAGKTVFAAGTTTSVKLDRTITPGAPPAVLINTLPTTISLNSSLVMTATANDLDENGGRILGWEWISDRTGHLCTTADSCLVPAQLLGEGAHQIRLRVQDDEGVWSQPATIQVIVTQAPTTSPGQKLFLPLVNR